MFRQCKYWRCEHYALHEVSAPQHRYAVRVCHLHVEYGVEHVVFFTSRWVKVEVHTDSAVVVGDIQAWRTWSITAYDESRQQIGA